MGSSRSKLLYHSPVCWARKSCRPVADLKIYATYAILVREHKPQFRPLVLAAKIDCHV